MKKLSRILAIALTVFILTGIPVFATETNTTLGNTWVYDEASVISPETEEYIKSLNEEVFSQYKAKPQLAFIIINDLPYKIEEYANDMFNEFGVGTTEENRGLLFVFALNDMEYAMEIGDGFEEGTILREEMSDDFITEEIKDNLRAENYDLAVKQVAEFLADKMADEENGIYAAKEAQLEQERIEEAKRQAEAEAELREGLEKFGIGAAICLAISAALAAIFKLVSNSLRKKTINNLMQKYTGLLWIAGIKKEQFAIYLLECTSHDLPKEIEAQFMGHAYAYYKSASIAKIKKDEKPDRQHKYIQEFLRVNNQEAFASKKLTNIYDVVRAVDREEDRRAETTQQNQEFIQRFWENNQHRIDIPEIRDKVKQALAQSANDNTLLTTSELESIFTTTLNEATFKNEVERFVKDNRRNMDLQDYDANAFIRELKNTEEYRDYECGRTLQHAWMMSMLANHIRKRNAARLEQERREEARRRREAQQRREEEEAAAQALKAAQSIRSSNSSFGSGFDGGSSSGSGGFKGGW